MTIRTLTATIIAPLLKVTGYRFDKSWRRGDTAAKAFVYDYLVCTVTANIKAGI